MGVKVTATYDGVQATGKNFEARDSLWELSFGIDPSVSIQLHARALHAKLEGLRKVTMNSSLTRSAFSCAEAAALGNLLHSLAGLGKLAGEGIDWGEIKFTIAVEDDGARWQPCANCSTWLEKLDVHTYRLDRPLLHELNMRAGPVKEVQKLGAYDKDFPAFGTPSKK